MHAKGLAKRKDIPVKVLAKGELTKALTVHAHGFSQAAREADRSRRRHLPGASRPTRPARTRPADDLDDPRRIQGRARSARSSLFTARDPRALPARARTSRRRASTRTRSSRSSRTSAATSILGLLNLFSGGGLGRIAIFALGIMPYITASIILQLLQVVVPSLEKLQKEGEVGQARITQYTRYLTVGLAFAQSIGYVFLFRSFETAGRHDADLQLQPRQGLPDRDLAHRRHGAADVDGRADHPARDRQRHLAVDLRHDRRPDPERHPFMVDQPRPGRSTC